MERRTFEGHMDWEYQNSHGPVDASSPFSQIGKRNFMGPSFGSESPSRQPNPFAALRSSRSAFPTAPSPSKQQFPRPPSTSVFNPPSTQPYPAASPFRNPAFATPQKRTEEIMSECSGAEESPCVQSDVSVATVDRPDFERFDDDFARATITPSSVTSRKLLKENQNKTDASSARPTSSHASGRGSVPRGKLDFIFNRKDRIRKRKRQPGDKDVAGFRARLHAGYASDGSDDSDANYSADGSPLTVAMSPGKTSRGSNREGGPRNSERQQGVLGGFLSAINDRPNLPLVLTSWLKLGVNTFYVSLMIWLLLAGISVMRSDLALSSDAERSKLLAQMSACAHDYTKNRCAPIEQRMPALMTLCSEWEQCMNQDPAGVKGMKVSVRTVAETINEFVGVVSFKAWGFICSTLLVMMIAADYGCRNISKSQAFSHMPPHAPSQLGQASQPASAPTPTLPASHDPNQAYIWAPIGQTPRHIRRGLMLQPDTPTDTDDSPELSRTVALPPRTPSSQRSPSKGERSPSKGDRSPNKTSRGPAKPY